MHLGLQVEPQFGFDYQQILGLAGQAEAAGFRNLWLSDHFMLTASAESTDCLEVWTALAGLAVQTRQVRIGPLVSCQSYRNPALLAKMAVTVDRMSGGRLDFGIGAGWKEAEYRAYGYAFPSARSRVEQLEEAIEICTLLWSRTRTTFEGRWYRLEDAVASPKPIQRPLPVWVGGRSRRLLGVAARHAQGVNLLVEGYPSPAETRALNREVDSVCRDEGRDPETLERSVYLYVVVGDSEGEAEDVVARAASEDGVSAEDWHAQRPEAIVGDVDHVIASLRAHRVAGAQHANLLTVYGQESRSLELLTGAAAAIGAD